MENLELKFTKMHATGNDYIYIDGFNESIDIESIKPYIKYMCDRNFGVGSDGVIFIMPTREIYHNNTIEAGVSPRSGRSPCNNKKLNRARETGDRTKAMR